MKVLLAIMRVDRFASCENIVPRLQTSSILLHPPPPPPPHYPDWLLLTFPWRNSSTASDEEVYNSFHYS